MVGGTRIRVKGKTKIAFLSIICNNHLFSKASAQSDKYEIKLN